MITTDASAAGLERGPSVASARRRPLFDWLHRSVAEVGGMAYLSYALCARALRKPVSWGPEFAQQFDFTIRTCLIPLCLSAFVISFGPLGVQSTGFFSLTGGYDRMGSLYELVEVRYLAPLVVGIIVAGAAGTAICADLGARVVREEIAALRVLSVDPIKNLVLPRALALMLASLLLEIPALASGLLGCVLVLFQHRQPLGPTVSVFLSNATPLELAAATVKAGIYGLVTAIVCCYNGINVSGGPEGVGRAVNRSVVVVFLTIAFIDYAYTQLVLATHPVLSQVRG